MSSDTNVATVQNFRVISDKLKADRICTIPKHDNDDDDDDDDSVFITIIIISSSSSNSSSPNPILFG